jgi:hypothetical protein
VGPEYSGKNLQKQPYREEGVDRDIALLIADCVYNRLKSTNIRKCVRIARLAKNDPAQANRIIDTFA